MCGGWMGRASAWAVGGPAWQACSELCHSLLPVLPEPLLQHLLAGTDSDVHLMAGVMTVLGMHAALRHAPACAGPGIAASRVCSP